MRAARVAALAAALATMPTAALAHPPPLGIPGFFGGLLHPAFVPAHLLAICAVGLWIGQQMPAWGRAAPATFILALLAGLGVIALGRVPPFASEALLLVAMAVGLLVAWARSLPESAGCVFAALTGLAVGFDSPPEVVSLREANLMLLGTGFGGSLLMVATVEAGSRLARLWHGVAVRVLGSWIAAIAVLVFAVQLTR